jgi:hypothetical protein
LPVNAEFRYLNSELQTKNGSERNHFLFVAGTGTFDVAENEIPMLMSV